MASEFDRHVTFLEGATEGGIAFFFKIVYEIQREMGPGYNVWFAYNPDKIQGSGAVFSGRYRPLARDDSEKTALMYNNSLGGGIEALGGFCDDAVTEMNKLARRSIPTLSALLGKPVADVEFEYIDETHCFSETFPHCFAISIKLDESAETT